LFDRREFFSEQWNEAEFIAKDLKPKFFVHFLLKKVQLKVQLKSGVKIIINMEYLYENIHGILDSAPAQCRIICC
jgi:hypothetical protein